MQWVWDAGKNRANKRKHGLDFDSARRVFKDPLASTRPDMWPYEERWQTIRIVGNAVVIVVHTAPINIEGEEIGRIISARVASRSERKAFEEGEF